MKALMCYFNYNYEDNLWDKELLCVFREDDVAEAEFVEFKQEWDRLMVLEEGEQIFRESEDEISVGPRVDKIPSKLGRWARVFPEPCVLSRLRTHFRLEDVLVR